MLDDAVRQIADTAVDENRMRAGVEKARAVLTEAFATGRVTSALKHRIGRHTMSTQWTRWAAAAAVIAIGFGAWAWLRPDSDRSGLAFGQILQQIRSVQAVAFKITLPVYVENNGAGGTVFDVMELASGHTRLTFPGGTIMIRDPNGPQYLLLEPDTKRAVVTKVTGRDQLGQNTFSLLREIRDETGQFRGTEQIDGRAVSVFDAEANGQRCVVWADSETGLPVRAEIHAKGFTEADRPIILHDFRYDVEPDDSLLSLTPPEGYTIVEERLNAAERPTPTEQDLIGILGVWADLADGTFPGAFDQIGFTSVLNKMRSELGEEQAGDQTRAAFSAHFPARADDKAARMRRILCAFRFAATCQQWRYVGEGVKLGDADKPVCWWKHPQAEPFRVVYGDLTVRDVAADQLPKIP